MPGGLDDTFHTSTQRERGIPEGNIPDEPVAELQVAMSTQAPYASIVISPAVRVMAKVASGQLAASYTGDVTITLEGGNGTLLGTTTVSAVQGVATFSDLRVSAAGTGYTLRASADGLPSAVSDAFNVQTLVQHGPARFAWGQCFTWGMDEDWNDICLTGGLTVRKADNTETQFPFPGPYYDADPAWSPDGSRIAFAGYRHCAPTSQACGGDIYVMNADGSGATKLTSLSATGGTYAPSWSADGGRIAFAFWPNTPTGNQGILYVMNADGSNLVSLGGLSGGTPAWSPDGTKLAFTANDASGRSAVHIAGADGAGAVAITAPATLPGDPANDWTPSWSPDGSKLVFTRNWQHPAGNGSCELYVMNANGSNQTQITDDYFCAHLPAWSPDGRISYNGYESAGGGGHGLIVMNADGSNRSLVVSTAAWPTRAAWTTAQ